MQPAEQPEPVSEAQLISAAMRACDAHGDGEKARDEMRAACIATPSHLRSDLLEHLTASYPPGADAPKDAVELLRRRAEILDGLAPAENDASLTGD